MPGAFRLERAYRERSLKPSASVRARGSGGGKVRRARATGRAAPVRRLSGGFAGRPVDHDSSETRNAIASAALDLFRESGYEATGIRDVARRAGLAVGTVYHHFGSKEDLVFEFYRRMQKENQAAAVRLFSKSRKYDQRLSGILSGSLERFTPYRSALSAIARTAMEPGHPLSPFGPMTASVRLQAIGIHRNSLEGTTLSLPPDIASVAPFALWLVQMGVFLFWIHDRSADQERTRILIRAVVAIVPRLLRVASVPLLRPLRRELVRLYERLDLQVLGQR